MSFEHIWRVKAVEIAAYEQMEVFGELNFKTLFLRAKKIYNEGYRYNIDGWQTFWETENKEENKTKPEIKEVTKPNINIKAEKGKKVCPRCGEQVPELWAKHVWKKNGSDCGYQFE